TPIHPEETFPICFVRNCCQNIAAILHIEIEKIWCGIQFLSVPCVIDYRGECVADTTILVLDDEYIEVAGNPCIYGGFTSFTKNADSLNLKFCGRCIVCGNAWLLEYIDAFEAGKCNIVSREPQVVQ